MIKVLFVCSLIAVCSVNDTVVAQQRDQPELSATPKPSAAQRTQSEWPQLKGNSGFTGLSPDDSVKPPLKLLPT